MMTFAERERRETEADFLQSWDRMELFFSDDNMPWLNQMMLFIRALSSEGYDRHLRAGQSMITFIVSRAREHGLRDGQPCMAFDIVQQRQLRVRFQGEHAGLVITADCIEVTSEIRNLLDLLLLYPID